MEHRVGPVETVEPGGVPVDASGDMLDVEMLGDGTSAPFDQIPALNATLIEKRIERVRTLDANDDPILPTFSPPGDVPEV